MFHLAREGLFALRHHEDIKKLLISLVLICVHPRSSAVFTETYTRLRPSALL
jgi:hypothetical protein